MMCTSGSDVNSGNTLPYEGEEHETIEKIIK